MRGDFSRLTFRPENHYSGVRLQQGRVQLDSEFNEHVDIEAHRDRETARDVIGRAGAPQEGGGFRVAIASMLRGAAARKAAWAVGEDGTLLQAAPGASAWTLEPRPAGSGRLNAVHFPDDTTGWAAGDGAAIYRLGGAAPVKEAAPAGVTADLHDVHATGTAAAWAVGAGGVVLRYDGTAWKRDALNTGVTAALRAVHAGADACAVGDAGTIIAGGGSAQGWQVERSPADTGDLHGIFVVNAQHRWAVGEQGTILFSGGTEWVRQNLTPALTRTLRAVVFTSATNGTAVGDGGTIVSTVDGGATWAPQAVQDLTADLHDVVAREDGTLLAVGDDVALSREVGGTWQPAPQLPADAATGMRRGRTLSLSGGDMYVDGIRCENGRTVSLGAQSEPRLAGLYRTPGGAGTFGVYLQVQEQHLTAVEREELREVALGGPDTATRTRTVWQADLARITSANPSCADITAAVRPTATRGRLRARAKPAEVSTSNCIVPPSGGYERLENQLYRVEIHGPAAGGATSFKWSRDNASMVARLQRIETKAGTAGAPPTGSVTVSAVGRDATLGFGPEQLVEITDEGRMLRGEPGVMAEVGQVDGNMLLLENLEREPLTLADFPDRPIVRRWDGRADVAPEEQELESGVFVAFSSDADPATAYRTGDHWTIPARTLTGAVEWPSHGGVAAFEEPHGPELHVAPLALVTLDAQGTWSGVRECRKQFPPLTDLIHLYYVGGDGQEAVPEYPLSNAKYTALDLPLRVGVANGRLPVAHATVEFEVKVGSGRLLGSDGARGTRVGVVTDAAGIAACSWDLAGSEQTQAVTARFIDPLGQSPPQEISFNAHLSIATEVAYDGSWCPRLAGGSTVADALDAMTRLTRLYPLTGSGADVLPGESIPIEVLVADGCGPVDGATVKFSPLGDGNGTVSEVQDTTAAGIARCVWTPDLFVPEPSNATQHLVATLESVPGDRVVHLPSAADFTANLNLARNAQYTPPADCPELDGAATVQDAIDKLAVLLPRLYHVSGDGLEGARDEVIALRAGIAHRCGLTEPQVRFERQDTTSPGPDQWRLLELAGLDDDGIATLEYNLTDEARQVVRARMVSAGKPLGHPVYFNLRVAANGSGTPRVVPAARLEMRRAEQSAVPGEPTLVKFSGDSVRFDTDQLFDEAADPTRLVATRPGTYLATTELSWGSEVADGNRTIEILQNGEPLATATTRAMPERATTTQQATAITRLEQGGSVQLSALSESRVETPVASAALALAWLGP